MNYRIDPNLKRQTIDGFAFPLGWRPGDGRRPQEGYTITYFQPDGDLPETHQFHIVVSHERVVSILHGLFELLPEAVYPIIEAGSRDAYRQIDVLMSHDPVPFREFRRIWAEYEPLLLEDGALAAGAMSEDPYIEVFLDEFKGIRVNVAVDRTAELEQILSSVGLTEIPQHWEDDEGEDELFSVLDEDEGLLNIDDLILLLQRQWRLELNVEMDCNTDETGRELGVTLWHVVVLANATDDAAPEPMAYIDIWLSADCLAQVEELVEEVLDELEGWELDTMVTQDRVAFDDRPEALVELRPDSIETGVWSVRIQPIDDAEVAPDTGESGGFQSA